MFTGIVEEIGEILKIQPQSSGARITIGCRKVLEDLQIGASISVSGTCLSATQLSARGFSADLSRETLDRTSLGSLTEGARVNLERPLQVGGRLGGHLVNGHVDAVGAVLDLPTGSVGVGNWVFSLPESLERYVVEKGSITVDGISLTVFDLSKGRFTVAIIPATTQGTNLSSKKNGDPVNLEVDILAKYVEKLLPGQKSSTGSLEKCLVEYGYIQE